jgi:hypothetical protein
MLKRVILAALATAIVGAGALPVQSVPATAAAMTCRDAAKAKFPHDMKARHGFRAQCKAAWRASHKK